jgi:hypothetical protein
VNKLAEISAAVVTVEEAVATASQLVAEDQVVDLTGLDEHVAEITAALPHLPQAAQQSLKPRLVSLISSLSELTQKLQTARDKSAGALRGLSEGQRAAAAYRGRKPGRSPNKR